MHEVRRGTVRSRTMLVMFVVAGALAATLAATASAKPAAKTISVAIVANPQMQDIASLTPSLFTAKTGIKVNYTILDEGKLREVTTRDVGSGGKAFDAVMIGPYEAPQFGTAGLLAGSDPAGEGRQDLQLQRSDPRRSQCAVGERPHVRVAVLRRVVLPDVPQGHPRESGREDAASSDLAAGCDDRAQGQHVIDGRHLPAREAGLGRPRRFLHDGAQHVRWDLVVVDRKRPAGRCTDQSARLQDGARLLRDARAHDAGEKDAANSSFNECLAAYQAGKVAMWYDATVAAGLLEAANSPVKGKNGYAFAPVDKTKASGWLWTWALAIPKSSPDPTDAWKYISWATSAAVHQGRRHPHEGRMAVDPARDAGFDLQDPAVQVRREGLRLDHPRGDEGGSDHEPGNDQAAGSSRGAVRRHPAVPGRRQPLHAAVLVGHRRNDERHRRHQPVPANRVTGDQVTLP